MKVFISPGVVQSLHSKLAVTFIYHISGFVGLKVNKSAVIGESKRLALIFYIRQEFLYFLICNACHLIQNKSKLECIQNA